MKRMLTESEKVAIESEVGRPEVIWVIGVARIGIKVRNQNWKPVDNSGSSNVIDDVICQ